MDVHQFHPYSPLTERFTAMRCHSYTEITGNLIVHHTHHTENCTCHSVSER